MTSLQEFDKALSLFLAPSPSWIKVGLGLCLVLLLKPVALRLRKSSSTTRHQEHQASVEKTRYLRRHGHIYEMDC